MKKALLVTTVSGFVPQFEMQNVHILQNLGYEIHYASNFNVPSYGDDNARLEGTGIIRHQVEFTRSPYNVRNVKAYHQLKRLMIGERFDLVHCHTPMGGVLARLAAHKTGIGPVIYTAHGFHFYRGAGVANWIIYYPIERYLSRYTDMQITINEEDYKIARNFSAKVVRRIHGVGISADRDGILTEVERREIRKEKHLPQDVILLISIGELNENKNQKLVLDALHLLKNKKIYYLICGKGPNKERLEDICRKYGIENQVELLGYRNDLPRLLQCADILLMPSRREGLPTAVMEAMAYGLPVIGTDIRGNNELIEDGKSGFLVPLESSEVMAEKIHKLVENPLLRKSMGMYNLQRIKLYSCEVVKEEMYQNYKDVTGYEG